MKIIREYTVVLTQKDYNDLLAILAYTSGMVSYKNDAPQHELLRTNAKSLWYELADKEL